MFSVEDTSAATEAIKGTTIVNAVNPVAFQAVIYKATQDGYITITKDNAQTEGLKTYVFCVPDLIR